MGTRASRSGSEVVSFRLPEGAFNELAAGIYSLTRLLAPDRLDARRALSRLATPEHRMGTDDGHALAVYTTMTFGGDCYESGVPQPQEYGVTVHDIERLAVPDDGSELWIGRSFVCAVRGRGQVRFGRSATVVHPDGSTEQLVAAPPTRGAYAKNTAWLAAQQLAERGSDDYQKVVDDMTRLIEDLRGRL